MKKINLFVSLLLVLVMTLVSVSAVDLGVAINSVASSSTISGSAIVVNITIDSDVDENFTCEVYMASSLTANTTWATIWGAGTQNESSDCWNLTMDSLVVEDANDYTFNVTCSNQTDKSSNTTTAIIVDNTVPTAASSLTPTLDSDGDVTFSGAVTGSRTTSCTLYFPSINPGSASYSMTHSGSTCSHSLTGVPEQRYIWYIRASDETNTTDSSTQTTEIDLPTGSAKGAALWLIEQGKAEPGKSGTLTISRLSFVDENGDLRIRWILAIVGVIILAVWLFVRKR